MTDNIKNTNEFDLKSWHSSFMAYAKGYINGKNIDLIQLEKLLEICPNKRCVEYYSAHGSYSGIRDDMMRKDPNFLPETRPDLFPDWS